MSVRPSPLVIHTRSTSSRFVVDLLGRAQKSLPTTVTVDVPQGWTAKPASSQTVLKSNGVPASAAVPVTLGLLAGAAAGDHRSS